jgi:hypothetical protein
MVVLNEAMTDSLGDTPTLQFLNFLHAMANVWRLREERADRLARNNN